LRYADNEGNLWDRSGTLGSKARDNKQDRYEIDSVNVELDDE